MNSYNLIAVRYQDTKESNLLRSEFYEFESEKAIKFYNEKKEKGCYFLEIKGIEIEHGWGEIKKVVS